jgi:hypothetical protein
MQVQEGGYAWQLVEQMQLPAAARLLQSSRDKEYQEDSAAATVHTCPSLPALAPEPAAHLDEPVHRAPSSPTRSKPAQQTKQNPTGKRSRADAAAAGDAPVSSLTATRPGRIALARACLLRHAAAVAAHR